MDFEQQILWGVSIGNLLAALAIIFIGFAAKKIIQFLFKGVLKKQTEKTDIQFDDEMVELLPAPLAVIVQIGIWHWAAELLRLPVEPVDIHKFVSQGLTIALWFGFAWLLMRIVDVMTSALARASSQTKSRLDDQLIPLLRKSLKVIIAVTIVVMIIQNLGYSITSLIASLGIGGLALALAAQDTVANVFGSVVVFTDKPFQMGDWVEFTGVEGTVEEVGFRTTKIRRFDKSIVTVPNATFSSNSIVNHSQRPVRRIVMNIGVTYETKAGQMKKLLEDLRELIGSHEDLDRGFHFVHFTEFAGSSLNVQIYCFTKSTVWTDFLATREDLMLRIMKIVETNGLEIAFPTRTVYLRDEKWAAGND